MSTPVRWISVDDTSTDIKYIGGSWFADKGSLDAIGHNGPPFLSTLHGTNSSASFAFNFTGSGLRVMGTYTQNPGALDWACFLDGVNVDKTNQTSPGDSENQLMFCQLLSLWDGPHTVTVSATVGGNQTFWFDKIQYLPSASVSLENKLIQLDRTDPAILYGSGWSGYQTQTTGSLLVCNFYGLSLRWYATELSGDSTTGTWSIDDNPPNTFVVNGHGTNPTVTNNLKYFETPQYSMGPHKLTVNYSGDSSKAPLILAYLVVQNGTLLPSSTGSNSPAANATSSTNVGAIIGGAVGGTACLLIAILLFRFYRRRHDSAKDSGVMIDAPVTPFPAPRSSSDAVTSPSISYQTQTRPSLSDSNVTSERKSRFTPNRPQDGRMTGNISQFVTIPQSPSRQEARHPRQGPTKAQESTGNIAMEAFAPSGDDQQHSRNPSDLSSFSGPASSSGFVHQDSGVRITGQQPLSDIPPAYTPD